jgi:archaellum component FlaC
MERTDKKHFTRHNSWSNENELEEDLYLVNTTNIKNNDSESVFHESNEIDDFLKSVSMDDNGHSSLNNLNKNIENWENYIETLKNYLDLFTLSDANCLIRDFIKLENYLNSEYKLNERENEYLYFSNQRQIVEFLNKSLKVSFVLVINFFKLEAKLI